MKERLEVGEVVTTHGVNGEVRVYPWCDSPSDLCKITKLYLGESGDNALSAESIRAHKNVVIAKFKDYNSVEKSRTLVGKTLYAKREDFNLSKGRYFICDLIGAKVNDADTGEEYGEITDVINHGATDIYCISMKTGGERMIPAVDDIVISRDIEAKEIKIRPIAGLLTDEN